MSIVNCVFCKTTCGDVGSLNDAREFYVFDCAICGRYYLLDTLLSKFQDIKKVDTYLINFISENIQIKRSGQIPLWKWLKSENQSFEQCVNRNVENFEHREIIHADKPVELLRLLSNKLKGRSPFTEIKIDMSDIYSLKIVSPEEAVEWMKVLLSDCLIASMQFESYLRQIGPQANPLQYAFSITPAGWSRINELFGSSNSTRAFIAMSFKHPNRAEIQAAIEDACRETGWEGFTIDREEYVGGVSDEIIAKINQSRFVIADFTENKHGVYYEAGYAAGKGLTVIYLVKEDEMKNVHFDTKHINHITWTDYQDLKKKLINRINAVVNK